MSLFFRVYRGVFATSLIHLARAPAVKQSFHFIALKVDTTTGGTSTAATHTSTIDRQPKELLYLKPDGRIVFAISQYSGILYRSKDFGATWTSQGLSNHRI